MVMKKATYQYDNGTNWDEIMFKTTADQVILKDGETLQNFFEKGGTIKGNINIPNENGISGPHGKAFSFAPGGETVISSQGDSEGWIYFRPNGVNNVLNQAVLKNDGILELSNSLSVKNGQIGIEHSEEAIFKSWNHNRGVFLNDKRVGFFDWGKNKMLMSLESNGNGEFGVNDIYYGGYTHNSSGYTKLPNGFILQWGRFYQDVPSSGSEVKYDFNYPVAFPNFVAYVDCSPVFNQTLANHAWLTPIRSACVPWSNTGASAVNASMKTMDRSYNILFEWIAIGY